jgi:hypothetical protein
MYQAQDEQGCMRAIKEHLKPGGKGRLYEDMDTAEKEIKALCQQHGTKLNTKREDPYTVNGVQKVKKITFTCERAGMPRKTAGSDAYAVNRQERATSTKKCDCKFKINVNAQKKDNGEQHQTLCPVVRTH